MPIVDQGAPTGGRGITAVTGKKKTEVEDLITEIKASTVNRTTTRNSLYTSKNYHVDSVPVTGADNIKRCKVEIQQRQKPNDTVAVAVLEAQVSSDADVQSALNQSLTNQHIFVVS